MFSDESAHAKRLTPAKIKLAPTIADELLSS